MHAPAFQFDERLPGMALGSPEHLDKVFERFYNSDQSRNRSVGVSGLGLAIAKKIVTLHHGLIAVASEERKGNHCPRFICL